METAPEYTISIKVNIGRGMVTWDRISVHNVEELRRILKETYKKHTVSLESTATCCDDLKSDRKTNVTVDDLNEDDVHWLAEKVHYEAREIN